jgi:hypothetical protein
VLCVSVRKRWPFLVAGPRHMAKKKSFRSGPRIVSDNDRCTLLIVDSWLPPYASPCRSRCFRCREKAKTGSSLPRWPFRRQKARRQTHASGPATTIATKDSPRAIVLVHAAGRSRRFPKGIGHSPAQMPLMQDQRRISFGRLSSLPASSFQMMRAGHRIGIQRPWGSPAAARRNFNFRLPTLTVLLNHVRREVT